MQELQVDYKQADLKILDEAAFEENIKNVVAKYKDYEISAVTIKADKKELANLRKLLGQISDKRIEIKNNYNKPINKFETKLKKLTEPLNELVDRLGADVRAYDQHVKETRLSTVKTYIANKSAELQLDARLFDEIARDYLKASNFKGDDYTLNKKTIQGLDELIIAEFDNQQEEIKTKAAISGQCAEYGMTDQPYIRMLKDLSLAEILEQIKTDFAFEKQKAELKAAQEKAERERQKELEKLAKQDAEKKIKAFDSETGEILELETPEHPSELTGGSLTNENQSGDKLYQNEKQSLKTAENSLKRYTQKMTLEIYFEDVEDKERFKAVLAEAGFEYKQNYAVNGYQNIEPLTAAELEEELKNE